MRFAWQPHLRGQRAHSRLLCSSQVDNMLEAARFPVLLCPADSGHYSLLRPGAFEHIDVVRIVACVRAPLDLRAQRRYHGLRCGATTARPAVGWAGGWMPHGAGGPALPDDTLRQGLRRVGPAARVQGGHGADRRTRAVLLHALAAEPAIGRGCRAGVCPACGCVRLRVRACNRVF